jgi:hypothetical protein
VQALSPEWMPASSMCCITPATVTVAIGSASTSHSIASQILVDQHRAVARNLHGGGDVVVELRLAVDDFHGAAAQHVGRAHQHRIADAAATATASSRLRASRWRP